MWGDVAPDTITFEMMSKWRAALEKKHSRGVAHKTLRVWRTFWKIMLGMKVARTADPSLGIRNQRRHPAGNVGRRAKPFASSKPLGATATGVWRASSAVAWDTQFSRVDVRTLAAGHRAMVGGHLVFDRQADGRAKTGRAAIGTVSARTERLIEAYLGDAGDRIAP